MSQQNSEVKSHILVVDDEQVILRIVALFLEQAGYHVSTVTSTEEAYRLIDNFKFDVIMTDVMMPGEDGISFLAKTHQSLPDVPIIIMTGFAQLQMAVNSIKNGAFDFVHKPFDFEYLRHVVRKAVTYTGLRRMEKNYLSELEEAVARRTVELNQALAQLKATRATLLKAASDKIDFMTTMAHEMRVPMNGVVNALDLLVKADLPAPQQEQADNARRAAEDLVELVDRLLSFSDGVDRCNAG